MLCTFILDDRLISNVKRGDCVATFLQFQVT